MKILHEVSLNLILIFIVGKGQPVAVTTDSLPVVDLLPYYSVFEDSTLSLQFHEILNPEIQKQFRPLNSSSQSFGYRRSAFWIHLCLLNHVPTEPDWLWAFEYSVLDTVEVYIQNNDSNYEKQISGFLVSVTDRSLHTNVPTFKVRLINDRTTNMYARIHTVSTMYIASRIFLPENYNANLLNQFIVLGVFFGILLAMIFYHFFLYITVREIGYLYYCGYVFSYMMYQMTFFGITSLFFAPNEISLNSHLITYEIIGIFIFSTLFARELLHTQRDFPVIDRLLFFVAFSGGVISLSTLLFDRAIEYQVVTMSGMMFSMFMFGISVVTLRKSNVPGYFFFFGISIVAIGLFIRGMRNMGVVEVSFIATNALTLANIIEVFAFALGFGIRIKLKKEEKEREKFELRSKFADDLHDDVSATLSSIDFYSTALVRSKSIRGERGRRLQQMITQSAREAKESITDIIWSVNPGNDTWENLLSKCQRFMEEMFNVQGIEYHLNITKSITTPLSLEQKQHIWLVIKELVTNICRHSGATKAEVSIRQEHRLLYIKITDNGKGFDTVSLHHRNGIANIKRRVAALNGTCTLRSSGGKGTLWAISLPLKSK